jgi:hypothetical protein
MRRQRYSFWGNCKDNYAFFRESCFHQFRDSKGKVNLIHYREPKFYTNVMLQVLMLISGTKPSYVCPVCFIHTYNNNMINIFYVQ